MRSALYQGHVVHTRHEPFLHTFRYTSEMTWVDLDELPTLFDGRWLWSTRRRAPVEFRRSDYLGDPAMPLKDAVLQKVESLVGRRIEGRVAVLSNLRRMGYVFNPVSFYFVLDPSSGAPLAFAAEITNTPWGERHAYAFAWESGEVRGEARRFVFRKTFHVSPFLPMDLEYDWTVGPPGPEVRVSMSVRRNGAPMLDAGLVLARRPMTGANMAMSLLRFPCTSLKVIAAIYFQALRLRLKGATFYAHPRGTPSHGASSP